MIYYGKELYHHGIKGQKWGDRNYQYEDGSLTPEGKKRYGVGNGKNSNATGTQTSGKGSTHSSSSDSSSNGNKNQTVSRKKSKYPDEKTRLLANSNKGAVLAKDIVKGALGTALLSGMFTGAGSHLISRGHYSAGKYLQIMGTASFYGGLAGTAYKSVSDFKAINRARASYKTKK